MLLLKSRTQNFEKIYTEAHTDLKDGKNRFRRISKSVLFGANRIFTLKKSDLSKIHVNE